MRKAKKGEHSPLPFGSQYGGMPAVPGAQYYEQPAVAQQTGPYLGQSLNQSGYNDPGMYAPPPSYYPQAPGQPMDMGFNIPSNLLHNPAVANMAMEYGQSLLGQGKEVVDKEIKKYMSMSRVKYYFSVDTYYVGRKLGLLLFPFAQKDWSVKFNSEEPIQPRYELNAPDLYIPTMSFITYILTAGVCLGIQNRFTPEVLGIQASSALVWMVMEVLAILLTLYVMNIQSSLRALDIIAFSGYKYVGMIAILLITLALYGTGYFLALIYCSVSLSFFLIRTLKFQVQPDVQSNQYSHHASSGSKRRTYLLLFIASIQPLMMWWLTRHLVPTHSS
nr:EOG090X0ATU [Triops cancriformis]